MPAVAIYTRASVDRDDRRISVDRQVERCEAYAADRFPGLPVLRFGDNNRSGSDASVDRPGYRALLAAIRAGEVAQLVVHEQSRLTRIPAEWDALLALLTRAGVVEVHTVLKGVVPAAPGARVLGRIMSVLDADESERVKLRAAAASHQLAVEGRPNGGRYYGYRRARGDDGRAVLVVDAAQAAVVRRIVDGLRAGLSSHALAAALSAEGVPVPHAGDADAGAFWRPNTVLGIARRPHIAGLRTYRRQVVGEGRWEPIVPPLEWHALQALLGSGGVARPRPRRWLLTGGLAVCGGCGAPMSTGQQRRPGGYVTAYICTPRNHRGVAACTAVSLAPAELVEDVVVEAVLARLDAPGTARRLHHRDDVERAGLVERLVAAERRRVVLAEEFGSGAIDELAWRRGRAACDEVIVGCRRDLASLPAGGDVPDLHGLRGRWDALGLLQRRAVVAAVVSAVVVHPRTARRPADDRARVMGRLEVRWR